MHDSQHRLSDQERNAYRQARHAAFLEMWKPSLDALLQERWGELYAAAVCVNDSGIGRRTQVRVIIEKHYKRIADGCLFNPDRHIYIPDGLMPVWYLYALCTVEFIKFIQIGETVSDAPDYLLARVADAPKAIPQDSLFDSVGPAFESCRIQDLSTWFPAHQVSPRTPSRALAATYWKFLASTYTGDQNHPWSDEFPLYHGSPVLVCDTCPQTPLQCYQRPDHDPFDWDHVSALTECQNYIASRLGVRL